MSAYADNGFGDLVNTANPYGKTTTVFLRGDDGLMQFTADTGDHEQAIRIVREHLGHVRLNRFGRWDGGPVLALIAGGKQ